ncbi:MAG: hypothetical protein PHU68_01135 [Paludibacter sp.]|nr:hypothetical protein [Paludibacter sp.]
MKKLEFDFNGNMGGITRMFAIPENSYKRIVPDHTNKKVRLEVKNRADIIDIYFIDDTDTFTEEYDNGLYKVQVSAIFPKLNRLTQHDLIKLDTENWRVLFQDNNDNIRLAGNDDYALEFRRIDTTGRISARNQVSFTFYGAQITPCCFIDLIEMDDL